MENIEKMLGQLKRVKPCMEYKEHSFDRVMSYVGNDKKEYFVVKLLKNISGPRISYYMKDVVRDRILTFIKRKTFIDHVREFISSVILKGVIVPTLVSSFFFVFVI